MRAQFLIVGGDTRTAPRRIFAASLARSSAAPGAVLRYSLPAQYLDGHLYGHWRRPDRQVGYLSRHRDVQHRWTSSPVISDQMEVIGRQAGGLRIHGGSLGRRGIRGFVMFEIGEGEARVGRSGPSSARRGGP